MMTLSLTAQQQAAVETAFDESLLICGPNRSGKSTALRERAARYAGRSFFASHPAELVDLAQIVLHAAGRPVRIVDEIAARRAFDGCLEPLFDLRWDELQRRNIDPEIAALRSPGRFADAAYRLLRKLRDAAIDAETFQNKSMTGGTSFYASPPNFAHADLIIATKENYRDSLSVDNEELQRQYRRELDLAKTLGSIYACYETVCARATPSLPRWKSCARIRPPRPRCSSGTVMSSSTTCKRRRRHSACCSIVSTGRRLHTRALRAMRARRSARFAGRGRR
jgi:hypothetical protein